ncbi:SKP1-like protein 1A [Senna tora]|uniref:SKP1-like protein 1A n=1 Tax=Senna tora TaxID=362788 RepID=A0A834XDQ2_9FABA|nr:SKP1-like protein 1A [Senna tora]
MEYCSGIKNLSLTSSGENLLKPVEAAAAESFTIKLPSDDDSAHDDDVIPSPDVVDDCEILAQVIEYCKKHSEAVAAICAGEKDMSAGPYGKDSLYDLTMATNYVNLAHRLLTLASNIVVDRIKRKMQDDEIWRDFDIKKNFTTEEEEMEGEMNGVSREINEDVIP